MSFKPEQVRHLPQATPMRTQRPPVFDPPFPGDPSREPSSDINARLRQRYRDPRPDWLAGEGPAGPTKFAPTSLAGTAAGPAARRTVSGSRLRTTDRRPLFPQTRAGWSLFIGLLIVPILTATLMFNRSAGATPVSSGQPIAAAGTSGASMSSGGAGTSAGPDSSANTSAGDSIHPGENASNSSAVGASPSPGPTFDPARDPTIPPAALSGYRWPLDNPMITLPFGPSDWGEFFYKGARIHDGIDIASNCGDYVRAAHDGTVLATGTQFDDYMGWIESLEPYKDLFNRKHWWSSLPLTVVIDDGNGFRSVYAHEYKIAVKVGQKVKAGQVIGYEGQTGNASGCHVHFGLFSPTETAMFALDPGIVARNLLPAHEVARVDPLYVLPFRCEFEEMRLLFPEKATSCGPLPTPTPKK